MLPGISGFDLCALIKKRDPSLPVIFLTAKNQVTEKREGLRLGADDYVTKPFDLEELLLRISNLIRRSGRGTRKNYSFAGGEIDFASFAVVDRNGETRELSRREIGLLELLTASPGKAISREDILNALWDQQENASSRTIDNYILGFRKYFEQNPRQPKHFFSVRGVGYKFVP
jgi:two-component system, OmpR family, alkaline phosphatase synthesis response regulator PhoP